MSDEKFDNLHQDAEGQSTAPIKEELNVEENSSENLTSTEAQEAIKEPKAQDEPLNVSDQDSEDDQDMDMSGEDSDEDEDEDFESHERVEIPNEDYSELDENKLYEKALYLTSNFQAHQIRRQIEQIREAFYIIINKDKQDKLEAFLEEGGNEIDFKYENYIRGQFSKLYSEYRSKRDQYIKKLESQFEVNYNNRLELIEELKGLINKEEKMADTYKEFKDIQERWKNAGPVSKTTSNDLWRNYHHHVENFYDYLRLNNEMRDLDFKHNLEEKLKIVERAEELARNTSIKSAFDELQDLHKMWKEEAGPVAKEFREEVWNRFSAATKIIHDKRNEYLKELKDQWQGNFDKKAEICNKIAELAKVENSNHSQWQNSIKEIDKLKDEFQKIGRVPKNLNNQIWTLFKDSTRAFNQRKNEFYKDLKKVQLKNLDTKMKLVELAESLKDSKDWKKTGDVLKKIQSDWKKIGHVPKQQSDEVWKRFREACNHFFNELSAHNKGRESDLYDNLKAKKAILESLGAIKLEGDSKKSVETLKEFINSWREIGKVPKKDMDIENEFNKLLDAHFEKLNLDRAESSYIMFKNKIDTWMASDDIKKVYQERDVIKRKIDEISKEISQLDNNLGFFNVSESSPLAKDVKRKMAAHKENLKHWKQKLDYLRTK